MAATMMARLETAPIWASLMPKLSMMGVVRGPISSLSAWWSRTKQKKIETTNQR
jgi:hypothetical protein